MKAILKLVVWIVILVIVSVIVLKIPQYHYSPRTTFEPEWGITFSKKYTEELGLDWKETYHALLDELGVDKVRIPVYWDDVSPERGLIDFSDYRYMLQEAENRNVDVIIALGERLPRWPECHIPKWAEGLPEAVHEEFLLRMIEKAVLSFSVYDSITGWQIENEPFAWWFGECAKPDAERLRREIALVRQRDDRPITVTDSGELGTWKKAHNLGGDILGITTYRVTWNKFYGYSRYPFPPSFYRVRAKLSGITWEDIHIMELQAEPWPPGPELVEISLQEQFRSFDKRQFSVNLDFARAMNASHAYLWGAEWWYWLKLQGDDSMWNIAGELWSEN